MRTYRALAPLAALATVSLLPGAAMAATDGVTRRVSVAYNTTNGDANGESSRALVSGNGRYVVYHSEANNLVANDTHLAKTDVFRTDMGVSPPRTEMVSVDFQGNSPNDYSTFPAVSNDGRYVAFMSTASDIMASDAGDTQADVFRRDMVTGVTQRVSVTSAGKDPGGYSTRPSISDDGRWVAFNTTAALVPNDPGGMDVYLRDMAKSPGTAGWMTRVTAGASGAADDDALRAILSGDGNFITFVSDDSMVANDTNGARDVYRWERANGQIVRASVTSSGGNIARGGTRPWINGDGRYVTFQSSGPATPGDNNGVDDVFRADFGISLHATPPKIERVSVTPSGGDAAGASTRIQINYDGRYVVFASNSHQLTTGDRNQTRDVFRRDMVNKVTVRVSVNPSGGDSSCGTTAAAGSNVTPMARPGAPRLSTRPDISNDGMHVIFVSGSCNLVPSDDNGLDDIFIRDYS